MKREIRLSATYPQQPREVWRALTDRGLLAQWLMPNDFEPRLGHRFTFRAPPAPGFDGVVHCEVLELIPEQRLALSWRGGGIDTLVVFEIEPFGTGTRLHFSQTGFAGIRGRLISTLLGRGWRRMIADRLPGLLQAR
jgi:uncharacterized protein YndB with AHSA1/START domain